jgi:hypothetical protein
MGFSSPRACGERKGLSLEPVLHKQKVDICYNYQNYTQVLCVLQTQFLAAAGQPLCLQGVRNLPVNNYNFLC